MKFHKAPKVDPEYFSVISLFANSRIKPIFKLISPDYYFAGMTEYCIFRGIVWLPEIISHKNSFLG